MEMEGKHRGKNGVIQNDWENYSCKAKRWSFMALWRNMKFARGGAEFVNAERVCASIDTNQWKEHKPVWMRKEYWVELCGIWREVKWVGNSPHAKINRAAHPEANVYTGGSISFAMHKVQMDSYSRGMEERYRDDSQHPELDPDIWIAASGAHKKGYVYGFGHSLGTARVISSCSSSVSHETSPSTTPTVPGSSSSAAPTTTPAQFREIVTDTVSQNISHIVS
ncbi:hypothetical protein Taro_011598 [Colocasia esculenta]|uniref:Uncharacterized protein n=1 Tax=Colocasia esculenta TaxID=4460 RepID=A0A843U6P1_COLES|nr:hypothetical protein [Colocasia esculenta]